MHYMTKEVYLDQHQNAIRTSEFNSFDGLTSFRNLAVKFVLRGKESYYLHNKKYDVKSGEYIIGNNDRLSEVKIKENTVGLCIDISNEIIREVLDSMFENADFAEFLLEDRFLVNKYNAQNTTLGYRLSELSNSLIANKEDTLLNTELFYSVGENVVVDQAVIFEQLSKLNYKKQQVSDEVFRNLLDAKNFMDDCFLHNLNLDQITLTAKLSKYAFIRLFKQTFGITPYHYLLQRRLHFAHSQIEKGKTIADVALETQFADTASFSKTFKQYFGVSPSRIGK